MFNENKEIPIIKTRMINGGFKREKSETIGTCFSDDVVKVLKSVDKKKFKKDSLFTINEIQLSSYFIFNSESTLVSGVWEYHISYSIYLNGIFEGGRISIEKSEFEQSLRDVKLNNLLD